MTNLHDKFITGSQYFVHIPGTSRYHPVAENVNPGSGCMGHDRQPSLQGTEISKCLLLYMIFLDIS